METILNILSGGGLAQPDGTMLFGAVFFTFMFMFFFVLALTDTVQRRTDIRKRAGADRTYGPTGSAPEKDWETASRSLRFRSFAENSALLSTVERGRKAGEHETEKSKLQRALVSAGFFGANSALWFQGFRFFLLIGLPLALHLLLSYFAVSPQPTTKAALLCAVAGVGFLLPGRYLARRQKIMRQECRDGFPDFMDLLVICAEAGLGPRAAIDRISREISHNYPFLGANLYLMSLELRAGATLSAAVENLSRRTQVEEVMSLGSLLFQTEQLGTSIGDALRIYSEELRDKRLSLAEEKAHALPVKLTLPLGVFIFPVMLVVIGLPVILRIRHAFY
jgi:tight adherence protein C